MSDLPDDVIEFLRQVQHAESYTYEGSSIGPQAAAVLEAHGVQTKTAEELLRAELVQVRHRLTVAFSAVQEAEAERVRVIEVNQDRGRTINQLRAQLAEAKARIRVLELGSAEDEPEIETPLPMPDGRTVGVQTPAGAVGYTSQEVPDAPTGPTASSNA